ncbi:DgyrCDS641 [Dimorphilus gyrociliatus]|uniref:DgyrCDS641 n=1 Tax=Dimorphilus gyrociliatus TaxID=2664684 RepID=A0A7I8V6T5_9ANNE|nr:DgyrCDS641 [Dimorphilus gyrociliatus]
MSKKTGVAIFGLGRAGSIHIMNCIKNFRIQVVWLIDVDLDHCKEIINKYCLDGTRCCTPNETQLVFDDENVSAVLICSPTFTHENLVKTALENGKAVFCEKPISKSLQATKECYDLSEKSKLPLFCSFNRRFDPSISSIQEQIRQDNLGKLYTIRTCSRDCPLPSMDYLKSSGGFFHDCAVHDIDMICWILNEYPKSVFAVATAHDSRIREMNDWDTAVITLKFDSGVIGVIEISRFSEFGYDQRLEIHGKTGMLTSNFQFQDSTESFTKSGKLSTPLKWSFNSRYAESYVNALETFIDAVRTGKTLEICKRSTVRVSEIADACEESIKLSQLVEIHYSED